MLARLPKSVPSVSSGGKLCYFYWGFSWGVYSALWSPVFAVSPGRRPQTYPRQAAARKLLKGQLSGQRHRPFLRVVIRRCGQWPRLLVTAAMPHLRGGQVIGHHPRICEQPWTTLYSFSCHSGFNAKRILVNHSDVFCAGGPISFRRPVIIVRSEKRVE